MRTINLFSKAVFSQTVLASSLLMMSTWAVAHEGHHTMPDSSQMPMQMDVQPTMAIATDTTTNRSQPTMDHSQHKMVQSVPMVKLAQAAAISNSVANTDSNINHGHGTHDHRKEHGAQIYAVTTIDNKWLVDESDKGALKSELETRIGTDENKVFIKAHIAKHESHDAEYDAKVLYSRMISDFWDAQVGVRYRAEKVEREHHQTDTEEKFDAVLGLHGMAQYFFETDAYFYAGQDNYSGFSLDTERDLLITQKLILKPYLEMGVVFSDDSKYAKKTGLSSASLGLETRYELSKKVMPYLDVAYEYSKGNDETVWRQASDSEKGWVYGAGLRFKF